MKTWMPEHEQDNANLETEDSGRGGLGTWTAYSTITKIPHRVQVQVTIYCTGKPKFAFAGTKWKNNIPATIVFLYWHGTKFQTYRQDILYWQAHQTIAFASTKWKIIYWQPVFFCTGKEQNFKHTGKPRTFCTGKPIKKFAFAGTKLKMIYRQPMCFCTGTEQNLKH